MIAALTAPALVASVAAAFVAGVVRGYSGFGLSAIVVTSLSLYLVPTETVPIAVLLEIIATLGIIRLVWAEVAWRELVLLLVGASVGTPLGLLLLTGLPAETMRLAIAGIVLTASLLLLLRPRFAFSSSAPKSLAVGAVSGVINGAAAVGGLPVVLYFLAVGLPAAAARATIMTYLLLLGAYNLAALYLAGLLTETVGWRALLLCLPLFLGIGLGHRRFLASSPDSFRRMALVLLIGLSLAGLLRPLLL